MVFSFSIYSVLTVTPDFISYCTWLFESRGGQLQASRVLQILDMSADLNG